MLHSTGRTYGVQHKNSHLLQVGDLIRLHPPGVHAGNPSTRLGLGSLESGVIGAKVGQKEGKERWKNHPGLLFP